MVKDIKYTEQELDEAFELGKLFVKCLENVSDDEGIYALQGKEYKVIDILGECFIIESEGNVDELQLLKDDSNFQIIIK